MVDTVISRRYPSSAWCVCACVCVAIPFTLDVRFVDVSAGATQESHRLSPPSFCGACLNLSREKDSAVPFPRRP